jgi:hypothetical protein
MNAPHDLAQGLHVAELAALRSAATMVLIDGMSANPDVVSLALTVTLDAGNCVGLDGSLLDVRGNVLGGFGL